MFLRLIENGNVYEKFCCLLAVTDVYCLFKKRPTSHFFLPKPIMYYLLPMAQKNFQECRKFQGNRDAIVCLFIYLFNFIQLKEEYFNFRTFGQDVLLYPTRILCVCQEKKNVEEKIWNE